MLVGGVDQLFEDDHEGTDRGKDDGRPVGERDDDALGGFELRARHGQPRGFGFFGAQNGGGRNCPGGVTSWKQK